MTYCTVTREAVARLPSGTHTVPRPVPPQVVVFNRGLIEQQGTPTEIIKKPRTPFIMKFVGETNVVPSTCLVGAAGAVKGAARLAVCEHDKLDWCRGSVRSALAFGRQCGAALAANLVGQAHPSGRTAILLRGDMPGGSCSLAG